MDRDGRRQSNVGVFLILSELRGCTSNYLVILIFESCYLVPNEISNKTSIFILLLLTKTSELKRPKEGEWEQKNANLPTFSVLNILFTLIPILDWLVLCAGLSGKGHAHCVGRWLNLRISGHLVMDQQVCFSRFSKPFTSKPLGRRLCSLKK